MAHWVKALAVKCDSLSSNPGTHLVDGDKVREYEGNTKMIYYEAGPKNTEHRETMA